MNEGEGMGENRKGSAVDVWIHCGLALLALWVFFSLPIENAVQFGGDDGLELGKVLLVAEGAKLYSEVWSDQPPLWTYVGAVCVWWFGGDVLPIRVATIMCAILLMLVVYKCGRAYTSAIPAALGAVAFMSDRLVMTLSVSTMQEIPVMAVGMLGAYILLTQPKIGRLGPIVAGGCVIGVAMNIKLSGGVFIPCVVFAWWLHERGWQWVRKSAILGMSSAGMFVGVALVLGVGSCEQMLGTHVNTGQIDAGGATPNTYTMSVAEVIPRWEIALVGIVGMIAMAASRNRNMMQTFVVSLGALLAVAVVWYRPWWTYYYIWVHLALCLGAVQILEVTMIGIKRAIGGGMHAGGALARVSSGVGLPIWIWIVVLSITRGVAGYEGVSEEKGIDEVAVVRILEKEGKDVESMYSQDECISFHAGIKLVPELAVVSLKRVWSGQIDTQGVIETLKREKPGLLLFKNSEFITEYKSVVEDGYEEIWVDNTYSLYRKRQVKGEEDESEK